jgi:hypothetical protein
VAADLAYNLSIGLIPTLAASAALGGVTTNFLKGPDLSTLTGDMLLASGGALATAKVGLSSINALAEVVGQQIPAGAVRNALVDSIKGFPASVSGGGASTYLGDKFNTPAQGAELNSSSDQSSGVEFSQSAPPPK